ncbi:hypothetical protein MUO14_07855 [Halobacillus shinanisalinarum]|uniref:Uncharacterized protein n=1 Tax=Halobacillus shinanisalinarum TaxID=2932258 RepID=A0ABY4H3U1_9BACI|nr:hypothetical protein [Halobacillus shinanisalinarum]UOQ94833.1 hypothetical protein MUO14_07855 [Halobacillus shinanisalinarum]
MVRSFPWIGIGLQGFFLILFFGALLPKMNSVTGAVICLMLGLSSLIVGLHSFKNDRMPTLSIAVIIIAVLILSFTVFAYFFGEGGNPPAIMQ